MLVGVVFGALAASSTALAEPPVQSPTSTSRSQKAAANRAVTPADASYEVVGLATACIEKMDVFVPKVEQEGVITLDPGLKNIGVDYVVVTPADPNKDKVTAAACVHTRFAQSGQPVELRIITVGDGRGGTAIQFSVAEQRKQ